MITLYQPPSAWGAPSLSPFCTKLEAYVRLAGIEYKVRAGHPPKGPTGKVPYIEHEGRRVGDSQLIIEYLKSHFGDPLDGGLTPEQRAQGHCLRKMLEESTYWALVWQRWKDPQGWAVMKPLFPRMLPKGLGFLLIPLISRKLTSTLHAQGTGRHSTEEIYKMAGADLDAASVLLGEKPFLFGPDPTSFDCVLYAFIQGITTFPAYSTLKTHALSLKNLTDHTQRLHERAFGGWKPVKSLT